MTFAGRNAPRSGELGKTRVPDWHINAAPVSCEDSSITRKKDTSCDKFDKIQGIFVRIQIILALVFMAYIAFFKL